MPDDNVRAMAKGYWITCYRLMPDEVTLADYARIAGPAIPLADAHIQTDFYNAKTFNGVPPNDHVQVVGKDRYYQIWFGHRMHYVRAADVDIRVAP